MIYVGVFEFRAPHVREDSRVGGDPQKEDKEGHFSIVVRADDVIAAAAAMTREIERFAAQPQSSQDDNPRLPPGVQVHLDGLAEFDLERLDAPLVFGYCVYGFGGIGYADFLPAAREGAASPAHFYDMNVHGQIALANYGAKEDWHGTIPAFYQVKASKP